MTVPAHALVASRAVEGDTVIKANVVTQDVVRQCQHLRMGNHAFEIGVVFGGIVIGQRVFDPCLNQIFNILQRRHQLIAGRWGQNAGQDEVTGLVKAGFFGWAKGIRCKNHRHKEPSFLGCLSSNFFYK